MGLVTRSIEHSRKISLAKKGNCVKRFVMKDLEENMKLQTKILDRAAFLLCYGAKLSLIRGHYPNCNFVLEGPMWLRDLEKQCRTIDYKKFCEKRRVIKRRARKEAGLPAHFTGETKKFTFMEVAHAG